MNELHLAIQEKNIEKVKTLLQKGLSINQFDEIGKTPFHYAVENEDFEMIKLLLSFGADINAYDKKTISNTPLNEVAQTCSYAMAKFLMENGADPTIRGWMQLNAIDKVKNRKRGDGPKIYELFLKIIK